jgi:MFS family permease
MAVLDRPAPASRVDSYALFGYTSIVMMLIVRILQGASAAVMWTVTINVMIDRIGTKGLGQAMGYVAIVRSVGIVIGPLLGGIV